MKLSGIGFAGAIIVVDSYSAFLDEQYFVGYTCVIVEHSSWAQCICI